MDNKTLIDPDRRFALAPDVILQRFESKAIIVDLSSELVYQLNETGTQITELLSAGNSVKEINRILGESYNASPKELESDVQHLVADLLDHHLIVERIE